MKRVWLIAKIAVLVAASYCIFSPGGTQALPNVLAEGCDTSAACARSNGGSGACYCTVVSQDGKGCTGCFVPNNDPGCGGCSGGRGLEESQQ